MGFTSIKVEHQIAKLRSVLSTNPNQPKPKALARLSYLLAEEAKAFNDDGADYEKINKENISEKCVLTPFNRSYMALNYEIILYL